MGYMGPWEMSLSRFYLALQLRPSLRIACAMRPRARPSDRGADRSWVSGWALSCLMIYF